MILAEPDRYPQATLCSRLADVAACRPDAVALFVAGREALTHSGLQRHIAEVARQFHAAGYGRRSRIAVALPSGAELAVAVLAVGSCATCAPLDPQLEEATLARLLETMRIDALLAPSKEETAASRVARGLGIAVIGMRVECGMPAGCFSLDEEIAGRKPRPGAVEPPMPDDVALLMHTSGTTATPKVVPLLQRRLTESALSRIDLYRLGPQDRCLLGMPLFTAAGLRRGLLPPLLAGGSLVCVEKFDAPQFVALLEETSPTWYTAPAAVHAAVLEEIERRSPPLRHALRFADASGAPMPITIRQRLQEMLGVPVIIGYGITETGSIAQTPLPPARTPDGSVGLSTRMQIRIRDDDGRDLGSGSIGEIQVRGPEVFDGYEDDLLANEAAFDEGWFRTGDLGWLDREGFLFIAGRAKETVNRGGTKIAPGDVETVLAEHPAVVEVAAFALPHPTLGEDLAAAVVLRAPADEDELRQFVRARLTAYKVPARILSLPEIPKAALGKPRRAELAHIATEWLKQEFVPPSGPTEKALAAIYKELLQVDGVGARDSFFQLGGDSLRGVLLLARVKEEFGLSLRLDDLYRLPTVASLAQHIDLARQRDAAGTALENGAALAAGDDRRSGHAPGGHR